jgi:hypothetical protein
VFGRGSEEAQALAAAGVRFEIVPGVTAGVAAPAYAGIPVTHRATATSVTFVTGHEDPGKGEQQTDWAALARAGGTIVLYMGVRTLPRIAGALVAGGMSPETPAAAVQWGTYPRQRTVVATLATLADAAEREGLGAPVITVIGPVVALRGEIAWFDRRPLFGKRVVVTRASAQAGALRGAFDSLGAEVLELPALRIVPLDPEPLREALDRIDEYDWIVFTSQNAVALLWESLRVAGRDARALAGRKLACVGRATADALRARGLVAEVVPERFVAEGVLEALDLRDDGADHGGHRRTEPLARRRFGERRERGDDGALARIGSPLNGGGRSVGRHAARHQGLGKSRQRAHPHIQHDRSARAGERRPVGLLLGLSRIFVARDEGDGGRGRAMRHGNPRVRRRGDPRRHAGDDLEAHSRRRERLRFLAPSSEHERVAPLESHDALSLARESDEQRVDRVLARRVTAPAALADVVQLHPRIVRARRRDDRGIGERVGGDRVAAREELLRAHGEQTGVTRSRADEIDDAAHAPSDPAERDDAASSRASRSRSRRARTTSDTT